jgi:hypothetical protein
LLLGVGFVPFHHSLGQLRNEDVEPQLFRGHISSASLGFYGDGTYEQVNYQSGISSTYQRYFEGPLIGLAMDGSIYHPNLLQYNLSGDGAIGWTQEKTTTSGGPTVNHSQLDYLGNFTGNALLLENKPYRTSMFVATGHDFHEYDFFNRVVLDTLRYGLNSGYNQGPIPLHLSVTHLDESTTDSGMPNTLHQTTLSFDAHNDRPSGRTTFTYLLNEFDRTTGNYGSSGTQNSFGLADTESFGASKNIEWRNEAAYTIRDFTDSPGDVVTAGSHLSIEHRTNLWSLYDVDYLRDYAQPTLSENLDGSAAVRHQLFASLTSGLRLQAIKYDAESPGSDFESTQYIGTWSELYTKKLSDPTRLTLGGSLGLSHMDQTSSSAVPVVGEAHTFGVSTPFLNSFTLNVLNVNTASIQVFDRARTIRYTENIDYSVVVLGAQTVLQLIQPNPSGLSPTTPVVVDYEAAPQGSGTVKGDFETAQIRLDFFHGMLGTYFRFDNSDYHAPANIVVQDVTSYVFGVDYFRNWLRAGFEYEIYDSTFSSYNSARLFQTLTFNPDEVSTWSLNFAEGWTDYRSQHETEQYLSAITRYHRSLTGHLGLDLEAGVTWRTGTIVKELLAAFRPGISYTIGKLSVKAGYDFEYQLTQDNQERLRNLFFIRAQRAF